MAGSNCDGIDANDPITVIELPRSVGQKSQRASGGEENS